MPRCYHTKPSTRPDLLAAMHRRPLERLLVVNGLAHWLVYWSARVALTSVIWPRFVAPFRFQIVRHPMPIPALPAAFEGYRVLFVSDLHVGKTHPAYLAKAFRAALAQRPDVVILGGDLISYRPWSLGHLADLLPLLKEANVPDGIFAVLGNHDYREFSYRHVGPRSSHRVIHKRLVKLLADSPVQLLRNQTVAIRRGTDKLQIVGIDEIWAGRAAPQAAFAQVDPSAPTIALVHNPDGYDILADYPWHWVLCGHTHGGQIHVPLLGPVYVPMRCRERLRGHLTFPAHAAHAHHIGFTRQMYVSTGIGYSTPLRMFCPPELALFTLTRSH